MTRTILSTLFGAAALFTLCLVTACTESGPGGSGTAPEPDPNRPPTPVAEEGFESTTPTDKTGG